MAKPIKLAAALTGVALLAAACASSSTAGTGSTGGGKTLVISTDLPMQGGDKDASESTVNAIKLYLDQINHKVGNYTIELKVYDNSTAAKGQWDDAQCNKNALAHVANKNEVAVMGTYNSGCAKLIVPILNADPSGPMLMVSHANTNPGLTKTWDPGEPGKFYPTGKRNYARVVTTDDKQGAAAAQFASQKLGVKKCYIVNDNQTYGQGVARAFSDEAVKQNITVLGNEAWDTKQPNYTALFTKIAATNPDCLFIGGTYASNGGQLMKDKVAILGDNTKVQVVAPDGFVGYPALDKQAAAEGMYLTFVGLSTDQLITAGGAGGKFLDSYKAKYGALPATSYAQYGVAALQVILAAIEKSDGTRKSVTDQVFSGTGVCVSADVSVLGKELCIDPKTGDTTVKDISVLKLVGGKETFLQVWPTS